MIARETLCGLAFVLSVAGAVAAQTPQPGPAQVITGVVQDETGAVLPGAALDLLTSGGAVVQSTQADSAGVFRFDAVASGAYQLRARFEGFATGATRLRVVGGRPTAPQKIVMRIGSLTDEITVTNNATQVDTAAAHNLDGVTVDKASRSRSTTTRTPTLVNQFQILVGHEARADRQRLFRAWARRGWSVHGRRRPG